MVLSSFKVNSSSRARCPTRCSVASVRRALRSSTLVLSVEKEKALTISTLCSRRGSQECPGVRTGWTSWLYTCNKDAAASRWGFRWRPGLCPGGPRWQNGSFSTSNYFLDCDTQLSGCGNGIGFTPHREAGWSERLSEVQGESLSLSLSACRGRAPGSAGEHSGWIHRGYTGPDEDLTLNRPGAFWGWI